MGTIGIHPKLKKEAWLYGNLKRWLGYSVVSGQFDHLVPPEKSVKLIAKKSALLSPPPFNGGGKAA